MEIYKYVWQYGTRNQLKDMLSKGEISDVMYKKFMDDINSYNSEMDYYNHNSLGAYHRRLLDDYNNNEPKKILKKKDIQLVDGVYYYLKDKVVIAIKGDKTRVVIKEGIEKIIFADGFMDFLKDYTISYRGNLHNIKFPKSLKIIDDYVFFGADFRHVELPENVEYLGKSTFARNGSLKEIVLSEKLHTIGERCFWLCKKLVDVKLPTSLKVIKENAFRECVSLRQITWPKNVEKIERECFYGCSSLENINFPQELKSIGEGAFSGCSSLKTIEIPQNLDSIASGAFSYCTSLQSIFIPENVKKIDGGVFAGCSSVKKIEFEGNLQELKGTVFRCCISLEEIIMPKGIIEIGDYAFSSCKSLKKIVIPETVELFGSAIFSECESLFEIKFPKNLQVILTQAFKKCKNLRVVYANNAITKIFSTAFDDCNSLQAIVIPTGTLQKMRKIFPNKVIDKLIEENQFQPETIVPYIENPPKEYIIDNVNRSFLKKFPWTYTKEVVLLSPCDTVGTCPKHLIYKRRDLLSYETKYQDYYYKIQNDFIQGKFYNLQDEEYITYAFILFFDLIESYRNNKNLENLLNQLEIMCLCCPKISKYIPEKLNSVINYKRLDDTQILKILDMFPDFKKEMFVPDYARLILRYTDSKLDKLKVMDCIPIKRITLSNSNAKRYKVSQEEIIKEVIDLVIEVIGKYDDFRESCYNAIKGDGFWSLSDMYWIILRRCYAEVLNKHKITKVEPLDDRDYGIDNLNEYIEEILYTN